MLRNLKDLHGYSIRATDGDIGKVKDFYFDDERFTVRYLVVETGGWLSSRQVLISPFSIGEPNHIDKVLPVSITKEQVKNSPDIDTDKPVSRQHEADYLAYYGYPDYWGGVGLWGSEALPGTMTGVGYLGVPPSPELDKTIADARALRHANDDPHLRSCKEVTGYHIKASDGEIGHIQSFIVDEQSWAIRYLVADTSNWWMGHQVIVSPNWIQDVSWAERNVTVHMTQKAIQDAPPYDPVVLIDRAQEIGIYEHYGRPGYW